MVGNRLDYDTAWNDAQSTVLYMRSKLLRIEIWEDPNGSWNSGDEVLIRKYVLGYGENGAAALPQRDLACGWEGTHSDQHHRIWIEWDECLTGNDLLLLQRAHGTMRRMVMEVR